MSRGLLAALVLPFLLVLQTRAAAPSTRPTTAPATTTASTRPSDDPDIKQLSHDAVSALARGENEKALALLDQLMAKTPDNVDYHLLDARALILVNKWKEAGVQAKWVLDHAQKDYQKEWANLYRAQAASKAGDNSTARTILKDLSANAGSAAVRTLASQTIEQLEP